MVLKKVGKKSNTLANPSTVLQAQLMDILAGQGKTRSITHFFFLLNQEVLFGFFYFILKCLCNMKSNFFIQQVGHTTANQDYQNWKFQIFTSNPHARVSIITYWSPYEPWIELSFFMLIQPAKPQYFAKLLISITQIILLCTKIQK